MNALDLAGGSDAAGPEGEAPPATTRRRPTRAAQARAAAAAQTVEAPVAVASEATTEIPARTRAPRGRARQEAPTVDTPVEVAPAPAPVEVETPAERPHPRNRHERFDRNREGREGREGRESREGREPREGREMAPQGERPQGDRPQGDRSQGDRAHGDRPQHERHDRNRQQQQGFRDREQGQRHREGRHGRDQRNRDQRGGGGRPTFREDNRGNRATEREIREMRETRELAEALMAEQGIEPGEAPKVDVALLPAMELPELYELARQLNIFNYRRLRRQELIHRIRQTQVDQAGAIHSSGILEVMPEGFGYLRVSNYQPSPDDVYVSQTQIRRYDLWSGDSIQAQVRAPKEGEKYFSLVSIDEVNGHPPESLLRRIPFENLTPIYPCERLKLETTGTNLSMRLMDLFNPLGKGQRALIVSPPKAGKTTLLKQVANSISENHPEVHLIALLIDERPEEVTDMQRSINGEVVASTFDELPESHIRAAELVMEKAKRQVEYGKDVVILLDSITRLARAYNSAMPPSGRTLSGGLDPNAMHKPKRFFGAARKLEKSGSLTIIATALIDTGSRMDEVIYEEFKGTGNSELTLDRRLADRRIFPAIDIKRSSTRKEELLLTPEELRKQRILRKTMDAGDTAEVTEFLADRLSRTKTNAEFLMAISDS